MTPLRWDGGPEEAPPPDDSTTLRSVCSHWVGTDRLGDATCKRNDPPVAVHQAFQAVNCRTSRHKRCPVFLGIVERPLGPDVTLGLGLRLPFLKRRAPG